MLKGNGYWDLRIRIVGKWYIFFLPKSKHAFFSKLRICMILVTMHFDLNEANIYPSFGMFLFRLTQFFCFNHITVISSTIELFSLFQYYIHSIYVSFYIIIFFSCFTLHAFFYVENVGEKLKRVSFRIPHPAMW